MVNFDFLDFFMGGPHYLSTGAFRSVIREKGKVMLGKLFDFVCENPIKSIVAVAATVATGGVALAAAPAIGAAASAAGLGVAGGTLSGAAASSAGLAALGGGSLASGGLGMAGGKAVVTALGVAAGGTASGTAAALSSDK